MEAGIVYYNGKCKPFSNFREIRRGRNKGRLEVGIRELRKSDAGYAMTQMNRIVDPDQIRRFPENPEP